MPDMIADDYVQLFSEMCSFTQIIKFRVITPGEGVAGVGAARGGARRSDSGFFNN